MRVCPPPPCRDRLHLRKASGSRILRVECSNRLTADSGFEVYDSAALQALARRRTDFHVIVFRSVGDDYPAR